MPSKRQLCVDCVHFRRCFELVPGLRGNELECHWDPSRYVFTTFRWDRASHRALAVGRGGRAIAELLNMRNDKRPPRKGDRGGPR